MRCIRCMREMEPEARVCGHCKFPQNTPPEYPEALAPGTELRKRFVLGKTLGRGGFGITYVGYDKYLDAKVAIKEYFPQTLTTRMPGEVKLFWRNSQLRDNGCENVIREAQKMHKLGAHPASVHVLDVFYENNTAYIAMDYVEGITLKQFLLKNGILSPEDCIKLMVPVLDTMALIHNAGVIHRDLSPDNIMIQPDMTPRILDLGAAKDIQTESGNTMPVARNGFSPKEQYQTEGNIGTWTDVYAICATMYYSLTGRVPPSALDRSETDDTLPFHPSVPLPQKLRAVLQDGMRMLVDKRIPDVTVLKERLLDILNEDAQKQKALEEKRRRDEERKRQEEEKRRQEEERRRQEAQKQKGFLPALLSMFGKKKPGKENSPAERKPVTVLIPRLDAYPFQADPEATIWVGEDDEEGTVLLGQESSAPTIATLLHRRTGKRMEITRCCYVLGRLVSQTPDGKHAAADGMIEDKERHVSRRHAAILYNGEGYFLHDISGKNITMLNGIRIQNSTMPQDGRFPCAYRLYDGDCIQLADETITFHAGGSL